MILQLDARTGEIQWEKDLRELAQRDPLGMGVLIVTTRGGWSGDRIRRW